MLALIFPHVLVDLATDGVKTERGAGDKKIDAKQSKRAKSIQEMEERESVCRGRARTECRIYA